MSARNGNCVRPISIHVDLAVPDRLNLRRPSHSESNINNSVFSVGSNGTMERHAEQIRPLLSGAHSLPADEQELVDTSAGGCGLEPSGLRPDPPAATASAPVVPVIRRYSRKRVSSIQSTSTGLSSTLTANQAAGVPHNAVQPYTAAQPAADSTVDTATALLPVKDNAFIKLCVGCKTFVLRRSHLVDRAPESVLAEFSLLPHDERLLHSHGYFIDTDEYLFERSPKLFDAVYKYYITGHLHRPMDCCLTVGVLEFVDELQYWRVPSNLIQACCMPSVIEQSLKNEEKVDPFIGLCCAGVRSRLWAITEGDGSIKSKLFSVLSIGLVMVSVTALVASSLRQFQVPVASKLHPDVFTWEPEPFFYYLESACIAWFTFEYVFRLIISPRKMEFMLGVLNVVDLLAVMPFYLELTLQLCGIDSDDLKNFKFALVMVRLLRSLRVMRVLKVSRYSEGMRIFALTIKSSASQLAMIVMVFSIGVIFFATLVYFMEKDEPDTPFTSIPVGFWWCIVTMTTVGYGDIVPLTTIGKIVGTAAIVSGVLVLALPITIMVDNFMKVAGK